MGIIAELQHALPYDVIPITEDNYAIAREVYSTNPEYFTLFGKLADDESILSTVRKVPDGFALSDKYLAAFCENGRAIAIIDLLAGYPSKSDIWVGLFLVHGDLRGKGLGAAIVKGVMQAARAVGFDGIHLGVVNTNTKALRFWEKMGFVYERTSGDFLAYKRSTHESL